MAVLLMSLVNEFPRYGMTYICVDGADPINFEKAIKPETKIIYIETPQTLR
jgi:O-acetylhomoserine/O-acetylserine sulfhydrylase-like pyridoxal-dependent enzyme